MPPNDFVVDDSLRSRPFWNDGGPLWLPSGRADVFYLVGIEAAEDASATRLRQLATAQPPVAWRVLQGRTSLGSGGLMLAHAACRFSEVQELAALEAPGGHGDRGAVIGEGLRYPARPGAYSIDTCDVQTSDGDSLTFVRFELVELVEADDLAARDSRTR